MGIYKLPKSQWTKDGRKFKFYWNEKDESGKWKKKFSKAYATKLEAMNAERDFLNEQVAFGGDMNMTFGELMNQYIDFQKNKVRKRTLETYINRRRYLGMFVNVKLKDLDGGISLLGVASIVTGVVFLVGVIDGYVRPKKCNE